MLRLVLALSVLLAVGSGCHSAKGPEVRVLGVHDEAVASHVFVQVKNPANRPMRLTRLEYTFASAKGSTVDEGDLALEREIPAGSTVVVEVPLSAQPSEPLELQGKITAELDEYVRTFTVAAQIQPH